MNGIQCITEIVVIMFSPEKLQNHLWLKYISKFKTISIFAIFNVNYSLSFIKHSV